MTNRERNARETKRAEEFARLFTAAAAAAHASKVDELVRREIEKMVSRFNWEYADAFAAHRDPGDTARLMTVQWWAHMFNETTDPVTLQETADSLPRPKKR